MEPMPYARHEHVGGSRTCDKGIICLKHVRRVFSLKQGETKELINGEFETMCVLLYVECESSKLEL